MPHRQAVPRAIMHDDVWSMCQHTSPPHCLNTTSLAASRRSDVPGGPAWWKWTDCDYASATRPMRNAVSSGRAVCARCKGLLRAGEKSDDGSAQPQAREKERGANCRCPRPLPRVRVGDPNRQRCLWTRMACRPAESATRPMAKAARPGNGAVCLALDAQRSVLARLVTPPSI
jgi:hypothetical protein